MVSRLRSVTHGPHGSLYLAGQAPRCEDVRTSHSLIKKVTAEMNMDRAKDIAGQAAEKASEVAADIAEKVGPLAEKASEAAAKGVQAAADAANKATGGRFEDKITSVSDKVGDKLKKSE